MSLRSMTGYGRGQASRHECRIDVEISSVNRRQLDIHIRQPKKLHPLESRIQREVNAHITRGRITVSIELTWSTAVRNRFIRVDADLAHTYIAALKKTANELGLDDDLSASTLLVLPEVVRYAEPENNLEKIWGVTRKALREALNDVVAMRIQEGTALEKDLLKRFTRLQTRWRQIERMAPQVSKAYRNELLKRLKKAGFPLDLQDERLLRELAFFAERSDISEELTRLDSHLRQSHKLIRTKEVAGRSLDFIVQEMMREINTIGSKANNSTIINHVVEFKAELERIREQVQNIE